ncbi:hypothetical protein ATY81_00555 [Rhizobium sp. R72]|nr:hypothetical protein ATY81_00555 [Rhizobium sp. R72]OWW05579.1 hypothetical protein ATY80_00555 [Rhizobium sp. R711]
MSIRDALKYEAPRWSALMLILGDWENRERHRPLPQITSHSSRNGAAAEGGKEMRKQTAARGTAFLHPASGGTVLFQIAGRCDEEGSCPTGRGHIKLLSDTRPSRLRDRYHRQSDRRLLANDQFDRQSRMVLK